MTLNGALCSKLIASAGDLLRFPKQFLALFLLHKAEKTPGRQEPKKQNPRNGGGACELHAEATRIPPWRSVS